MKVTFNKVTIHNFLSFGHAEIDLRNRNYCLVKGINNCPLDNAVSNGAGKSTFISAICWALTGETVQGVTSGIKNIFVDEGSCYVALDFDVDGDAYEITRIKEPEPNLKIVRNGSDVSGKGIRESNAVLAQYLPDMGKDLLTSVILLGQGLPNKFTDNTPSGRKEVLEKLSKSDFIIADIKERIAKRQADLAESLRAKDDSILKDETESSVIAKSVASSQSKLDALLASSDNSDDEESLKSKERECSESIADVKGRITLADVQLDVRNSELAKVNGEKSLKLTEISDKYAAADMSIRADRADTASRLREVTSALSKLSAHPDVCPTCGQRLPNAEHLLNEKKEKEESRATLGESLACIDGKLARLAADRDAEKAKVLSAYDAAISEISADIRQRKAELAGLRGKCDELNHKLIGLRESLTKIAAMRESREREAAALRQEISDGMSRSNLLKESIEKLNGERDVIMSHIDVVKKMESLVKRDFRGFLLSNIIEFIDRQAKDYAKDLFGTDNLDFKLDGNNIDIEYCGKDFAALSGGEKQRVDIIIQFAIRKMMSQYLDFNSNILCLDEVFDNLDAKATANVISLISNRMNDIESIFIVSHHADELSVPTDSSITIVKNVDGVSSVE